MLGCRFSNSTRYVRHAECLERCGLRGQPAIVNHVVPDWPLPSTEYRTLYLDSSGKLNSEKSGDSNNLSYQADVHAMQADNDPEELRFEYIFTEKTYLLGYPRATLYVSCEDHDEMDIFVQLRKTDEQGNLLQNLNVPQEALGISEHQIPPLNVLKYLGPTGMLRASHRALDEKISKPYRPMSSHKNPERIAPGTITKLEIGIWPMAIAFQKNEKLVMKVAGHHMTLAEFIPLQGAFTSANKGRHLLHVGGQYSSSVDLPFAQL